ncbi:glycoside hydrolase family 2 TIM barrel-domain containing protein [Phycisphaerales bacterium AB-hyl4]|uniref:Glycoside hydrolase family 2 TIM barrel-domain containing protein n=1 Tax=Natronomicrosphaera hydrolytica TaxID=3242702 RepID=A0ABV4U9V9_9BACT
MEVNQPEKTVDAAIGIILREPSAQQLELWLPESNAGDLSKIDITIETPDGQARHSIDTATMVGPERLRIDWPAGLPRMWWEIDQPQLYRLMGRIEAGEQAIALDHTFGLRWWSTEEGQIRLNGHPFYARGCIRGITAHDHPNLTGLTDQAADEKNIRAVRDFGFNYVRWHSTIPSETYLDAADRLGLAVQVELGFKYKNDGFHFDQALWERTIRRISRHPSVAVYCLGNEIREAGKFPEIQAMIEQARQWDPAPMVMDNCGWGQPDRPSPDVYCQHVAYFFPYGDHADMFDRIQGFELEGFCQTPPAAPGEAGSVERPLRPVMAHEVCHYIAMRDLDQLEQKWRRWHDQVQPDPDHSAAELPWWINRLRELYREKGIDQDEPELRRASQRFQGLAQRHVLESIRLNPVLQGYQMLQMSDCWKYENTNGLLDAFDDPIHWNASDFARFNGDTALLVRFGPERSYKAGSTVRLPAYLSHYGKQPLRAATMQATLRGGEQVLAQCDFGPFESLAPGERHDLGEAVLTVPAGADAQEAELTLTLKDQAGEAVSNRWKVWILPVRGEQPMAMQDPRIIRELTPQTLEAIAGGEHRLWLYRPDHLFDETQPRPAMDFTGRRELMKGVIWDRGDNLGAVVREHPAIGALPHDGVADWQIAPLLHLGAKINLDSFPVPIRPIVLGVDRPVRDRMEVAKFGKKDFDPAHTCRRWGWLFELAIGKGRLLVCGLNLDATSTAGQFLLENMLSYLDNPVGEPSAELDANTLRAYLTEQASTQLPGEPPMTLFWLRDKDPVETTLFWQELGITLR